MQKNKFDRLDALLKQRDNVKKYYWAAALLFWLGIGMTIKYLFVQTGTVPSWLPAVFIISGMLLYFAVRQVNK